jgi:phenylacetate-CoA ligase
MHGLALIYILRDLPGVAAFKIVQHSRERCEVLIQAEADADREAMVPRVISGFRQRLGAQVEVDVSFVDGIPPERSGKFRYVVSHVSAAIH